VMGEGAGFWRSVTADLRNSGVQDILIALVELRCQSGSER
jgi:transposase-like protein